VILPVDDDGSGSAVVLLHAGVADRRMWRQHVAALAQAGYRAIAMDLPGFGEAVPEGEVKQWSDVLETLDALGVDRAALIGNSLGAAIALDAAVVAPDRVWGLMLVSTPPPEVEPSSQLQAAWDAEEAALERGDIEGAVEAAVDAWTLPDAPSELRARVAEMQRRAFEIGDAEYTQTEEPVEANPAAIDRIAIPALVCAGSRDMPDFVTGAESLAGRIESARHVVIDGAGHLAPLERPEQFLELALEFLAQASAGHLIAGSQPGG
jgi:pimeloyl-ACP methyl ester carboxylesterase